MLSDHGTNTINVYGASVIKSPKLSWKFLPLYMKAFNEDILNSINKTSFREVIAAENMSSDTGELGYDDTLGTAKTVTIPESHYERAPYRVRSSVWNIRKVSL